MDGTVLSYSRCQLARPLHSESIPSDGHGYFLYGHRRGAVSLMQKNSVQTDFPQVVTLLERGYT